MFDDMHIRFDKIPACAHERHTDGWSDRQTDIMPQHSPRYAYSSRDKNAEIETDSRFQKAIIQ